jgi:hypothetical protein
MVIPGSIGKVAKLPETFRADLLKSARSWLTSSWAFPFTTYSSAPASSAAILSSTPARTVSMTRLTEGSAARTRRHTSSPDMLAGPSIQSMSTSSKRPGTARRSASSALHTCSARSPSSRTRSLWVAVPTAGSSSTCSTEARSVRSGPFRRSPAFMRRLLLRAARRIRRRWAPREGPLPSRVTSSYGALAGADEGRHGDAYR